MNLYSKLSKKPHNFQKITGVSVCEFNVILKKMRPLWKKRIENPKKVSGRPYGLGSLENHFLCLLLYYRTYSTCFFLSFWFRVDISTISRSIKRLEPILAKIVAIKKNRTLKQEELETILIDCTEQPIERPQRKQKKYYSGKKKRHTIKTEIQVSGQGGIVNISPPYPGSMHDFEVRKRHDPLPTNVQILADSGYQGLQKEHRNTSIPYKRTKKKPLSKSEKAYNKRLSRMRIKVEHKIREMKIFRILKDTYRNKRRCYGIKTNIVAGIINMRHGF